MHRASHTPWHALTAETVTQVPLCCRSKRVLGIQRQGRSKQTMLQWQGSASYSGIHQDCGGHAAQDEYNRQDDDDDAAMAAADNIDLNQL